MHITQKTRKTLKDKREDIKLMPLTITPNVEAQKLFGLHPLIFTYNHDRDLYMVLEHSGIIREGFTGDFYRRYHNYFIDYGHID